LFLARVPFNWLLFDLVHISSHLLDRIRTRNGGGTGDNETGMSFGERSSKKPESGSAQSEPNLEGSGSEKRNVEGMVCG
jgi:hypothetical protein